MTNRPPGPGGLRQFNVMRKLLSDPQPVLEWLRDHYGPVCGLGVGPGRMAVVGDPAALRELYAYPTDAFRWGHKFNVLAFVVGDGSMIVSDGPDHARRRGSVQTAFSRRRLNGWIPMIVEQTDAAIDRVASTLGNEPRVVDLYPVARAMILEVVVRAFFGARLAARAAEIGALFQGPQDYLEGSFVQQLPHPFPHTKRARVRDNRRALDAILDTEIAALRRAPAGDPDDVLDALVQDGQLSDAEIRDQALTLIGAGYDTTSASLSWILWRAALATGTWERLRAEANEVFGAPGADAIAPDHTTLARLDFANRVMRETLRLHPAGVVAPREAAIDIEVDGYTITKGTLVLPSAYLSGRDPKAWPEPLVFDPDRFADPSPEQKAAADQAWTPFGRGARNCIGSALAQMELTLMIARLAQRLDVTATGTTVPRPVGLVVNRPAGGAPLRVAVR